MTRVAYNVPIRIEYHSGQWVDRPLHMSSRPMYS